MLEILAPAGGAECAYAAINAGADAIYTGLDKFSARSSAENFDSENFNKICAYAHAFGVKVYVALNTLVKDGEVQSFLNTCTEVWNAGADALIIQDIFIGKYLKEKCPDIRIHLSTQSGTCNVYGAKLAKSYGFDRVILARETSFEDIKKICKIIETEVFVQGALCTCFSGQCYMSSFAGRNSGNRGKCKQPCRKLYSYDRNGFDELAYRLSLSDLCVGEDIEKYIEAGVVSFKIEGRMRRAEYVYSAVKYYKNILNGKASEKDFSDLKRAYNRGNYTKGLSFGQDKSFISSAVQGHIGEFAGVVKVENAQYICQSKLSFTSGDCFKILRNGKEVGGGSFGGAVKGGFKINTRKKLRNGDKVFITTDTSLSQPLTARRLIPVSVRAEFLSGQPPKATINGVTFCGENILEKANSRPLSEEEIACNFAKVDVYPFAPDCSVNTDGVFMPVSALNSFRRSVYENYYKKISSAENREVKCHYEPFKVNSVNNGKTAVISTDLSSEKADIGILKLNGFDSDIKKLVSGFEGEKYLYVPPFATGEELTEYLKISNLFDGIYCDGYFGIMFAEEACKPFFAGLGFNITNNISLSLCKAKYVCISKELTLAEAEKLSAGNTFYLSAGSIKVMDLIYCPFEKKCSSCDKRNIYTLTDGEGRKFPVRRYVADGCRFEVYNCADLAGCFPSAGQLKDNTVKNTSFTKGHTVNGII